MRRLPESPNLEHLKNQAKDLRRSHRAGRADECADTLRRLPRFAALGVAELLASKVSLTEAQAALALDYGYDSWDALRQAVLALTAEPATPSALVPVCAHCGAVRTGDETWREPPDGRAIGPLVTHGICPACFELAWRDLD